MPQPEQGAGAENLLDLFLQSAASKKSVVDIAELSGKLELHNICVIFSEINKNEGFWRKKNA